MGLEKPAKFEFNLIKDWNFDACMKPSQQEFEKFENRFAKKSESEKRRGVLKRRKPFLGTVHFIGEASQACHEWIFETYCVITESKLYSKRRWKWVAMRHPQPVSDCNRRKSAEWQSWQASERLYLEVIPSRRFEF